jgi:DNA topoisomerase-1
MAMTKKKESAGQAPAKEKTVKSKTPAGRSKTAEKKSSGALKSKTAVPKRAEKSTAKQKNFQSRYEGKTLVVVESPAKAKTLEKILGSNYRVLASVGHVRDLPKGRIAIDVENGFEPEYIQVRGKADLIRGLKSASDVSKKTLLASDPDREGEAIAWHLASLLGIDPGSKCRIRMHEITKNGVKNAVASPDVIDIDKVDAQQARRVLDRLVGYQLSPLLWYKVQRGLSAGRVQSVALKIVCEREDEIEKFIPEEYWLLDVESTSTDKKRQYTLRAEKYQGKPLSVKDAGQAENVENDIRKAGLVVDDFKTRENSKTALPPLKTSTLQQEASRRCGFPPRRTMRIAQSLYEGIDIPGRGPTGLITYMRTDSLRLAPEAIEASRSYIKDNYGEEYLPHVHNEYTPKGKAQDAHEAIRATDPALTPDSLKPYLSPEQYRLYDIIWRRFIASQMSAAKIARTVITCSSGDYQLKQTGVTVVFDGWGRVFPLGVRDTVIAPAVAGEPLCIADVKKEQRFTQPPSRYTEAGLVKALDEKGIGRPSTYATIIETLSLRGYVVRSDNDKKLIPTKLGRIVNAFLVRYFSQLINIGFTAMMENELDQIEQGDLKWKAVVGKFWDGFKPVLDDVSAHAENMRPEPEFIGEKCPECGKELIVKNGRFGEFIACSGYPECRYTRKIVRSTGIKCPKCNEGELVRRRSNKGKTKGRFFYGCTRYPDCDYISWKKPGKENTENQTENPAEEESENYETDM